MDRQSIANTKTGNPAGEGRDTIIVASFTHSTKVYEVHPETGTCTCPRYTYRGDCEKHVLLARAIEAGRGRPFFTRADEEVLIGLIRRIYTAKTYRESYEAFVEASYYRYATDEVREVARKRHAMLVDGYVGKEAA